MQVLLGFLAARCAVVVLSGVVVLMSVGCAVAPLDLSGAPDWTQLKTVKAWKMKGRVSFRHGKEGWHGKISWESDGVVDRVKISGPIGQGALLLRLSKGGVEIHRPHGVIETVRDSEALLKEHLGFAVPLQSLRWWIRGLPAPSGAYNLAERRDDFIQFRQVDWLVSQQDFRIYKGQVHPYRLKIQDRALTLRLVVDRWDMGGGHE